VGVGTTAYQNGTDPLQRTDKGIYGMLWNSKEYIQGMLRKIRHLKE